MDLTQATGTPETITISGREYPVRLLNMREWASVQSFLKKEQPSPVTRACVAIDQARAAGTPLSRQTQDAMLDHAQVAALNWPPRLGSDAWFDALARIDDGDARLLHEVLSKTDAAFTIERARELAPAVTSAEWGELIRVALFGTHPRPKGEASRGQDPP